eukprot:c18454_g1_i1.p1 GENE.c18454_g1_i1~~c18454_g1_i1.p1  ORF type:complete len:249 (+),score=49.16 c18454_g1_i1:149-895(+)
MESSELLFAQISLIILSIARNNSQTSSWINLRLQRNNKVSQDQKVLFRFISKRYPSFQKFLSHLEYETEPISENTYIFALCLLKKLETTKSFTHMSQSTIQGIFYICFTLAFKYLEDEVFTSDDFAEIAGMEKKKYVSAEIHYIEALQFNLTITPEDMEEMKNKIDFIWSNRFSTQIHKLLSSSKRLNDLFQTTTTTTKIIPDIKNLQLKLKKVTSHSQIFIRHHKAIPKKSQSLSAIPSSNTHLHDE